MINLITIGALIASISSSGLEISAMTQPEIQVISVDLLIKQKAKEYGLDYATLDKIVSCESQYNINAIGRKAKVGVDMGLLQVNTHYHTERAKSLGYDLNIPEQSFEYGLKLMKSGGLGAWSSSESCWG
jgi:hypothetical protein